LQGEDAEESKTWECIKLLFTDNAPFHFRSMLGFAPELEKKVQDVSEPADVDAESFFDNISREQDSKASSPSRSSKLESPKSEADVDDSIKSSLLIGDYSSAGKFQISRLWLTPTSVSKCFASARYADALLLSSLGGPELWASTQERYLKNHPKAFIRNLVYGVVNHNFAGLIQDSVIFPLISL
jgi:protein transport protein SEC31